MLDVKSAVKTAFDLFKELYTSRRIEDVLLEEVELSPDRNVWLVTLGFCREVPSMNIMESIGSKKFQRCFKTFHIDAASGQLLAMKNSGMESP